jgi:hypothetical protein
MNHYFESYSSYTNRSSGIKLGKITFFFFLDDARTDGSSGAVSGRIADDRTEFIFFSVFRASANKTFGIRPSAPSKRIFIIESEANLLQLFIHQWKNIRPTAEARMRRTIRGNREGESYQLFFNVLS